MGSATLQAVLRASITTIVIAGLLAIPAGASAQIRIEGGSEVKRAQIEELLEKRFEGYGPVQVDLVVAIGSAAFAATCEMDSETPVLAVYVYETNFHRISARCRQPVAGIFADAPLQYLYRTAEGLFPGSRTAMLVNDDPPVSPLEDAPSLKKLSPPQEGVAKGLGRLIRDADWDVFLLPVDASVYEPTDYRLALETLFRQRKASIASIPSLLPRGAVAAAYYNQQHIEDAILRSVSHFIEHGELIGGRPDRVSVSINKTVLRNLYGRALSSEELDVLEAEVNGGE